MEKYVMVVFPDVQAFMEHPRWGECIFCQAIEGHECPDSAYMIPEDLYNEVRRNLPLVEFVRDNLGKVFLYEDYKVRVVGYGYDDIIVELMEDYGFGWEQLDDDDILYIEADKTGCFYYVGPEELDEIQ